MAVKISYFESVDGNEFKTKKQAENHDAAIDAIDKFCQARRDLAIALAKVAKTADGHDFEIDPFIVYHRVVSLAPAPFIEEIEIYESDVHLLYCETIKKYEVKIKDSRRTLEISELYKEKRAAQEHYVRLLKLHIRDKHHEIEHLEQDLGLGRVKDFVPENSEVVVDFGGISRVYDWKLLYFPKD